LAAMLLSSAGWRTQPDHPAIAYSECHAEGTCTGSFVIRKGSWKYIYYSYYEGLIFNMKEDPEEMHNLINTPEGRRASSELIL